MRLSTSTNICAFTGGQRRNALPFCITTCAEHGYQVLDINLCEAMNPDSRLRGEDWEAYVQELADLAQGLGVRFSQSHLPYYDVFAQNDPAKAALMEELISIGISRFVCIGSAGLISKEFDQNKMLVVTEAIRDEGTSYHYLPAGEAAYTSPLLREQLKDSLARQGVDFAEGKVWTTDAFYRETPSRVARRLAEGAIAVEMECAALCAVAQRRGVEFAQALFFSDSLLSEVWSGFSRDYPEKRLKALDLLLETGLELAGLL